MANEPLRAGITDVIISLKRARRTLRYIAQELQQADSILEPLPCDASSIKWPTDPRGIGATMRAHRLQARLSLEKLAKLTGVARKTIQNIDGAGMCPR